MATATAQYSDLLGLRRYFLLVQVATQFVTVDCLAQTVPTPPAAAGTLAITQAPASPSAPPSNVQEVTISGNPSLLHVPNPWPWDHVEPAACTTFHVSAVASIETLDLYASGLGRTLMAAAPTDRGAACPDPKDLHDRLILMRPNPTAAIDTIVAIQIATDQLASPGASTQGNVIALARGKRVGEFTLKVERPPRDELWTAITWVLTILIPAIVTFLIGQMVVKLTALQKTHAEFREYRLSTMAAIQEFLTNVDTIIRSEQDHAGQTVYTFIIQYNILSRMPKWGIRKLSAACASDDLRAIVSALRHLFPEFKYAINGLEESIQTHKNK